MANAFLLNNPPPHGPHNNSCFCEKCRDAIVNAILQRPDVTQQMLYRIYFTTLTQTRESILDTQFEHTKEEIIMGYTYKQKCLSGSGYRSFGHWLANAPDMLHLSPLERDRICDKISQVTTVFEKWETIVENLTMPSMNVIDARRYSIYQLSRAVGINWCIRQRDNLIRKRQIAPVRNPCYSQEKFQQLIACVRTTGILDDVSHSRDQARLIADQFREEILALCNPSEQ